MAQLRHKQAELDAMNMAVLIVSFESSQAIARYASDPELAFPIVNDPERRLYRAYDMDRASFLDVWGPRTWWAYARAMAGGAVPRASSGDTTQRGGDVLIDPDGIVRLHHVGRGPADRPEVEAILGVARQHEVARTA